ncbi:laminin subunit alpha, partial [Caerostris extrusa]
LSSYGSFIRYTYFTSVDKTSPIESSVILILFLIGNNITIVHDHIEQPADGIPFSVEVSLIEHEFHHISGRGNSRADDDGFGEFEAVLIRGSYFQPVQEIKLSRVLMDTANDNYIADAPQALRVEQCHCPPSYMGRSCEECAPGYYRSKTGPYLGYCVACQCNGHAQTCDVNTGKCIGCQHNTVGDHCEKCEAGYHGDSTQGTPYDCLICACPLPITSNNFAESCEVSPSGKEISCVCKPGYYGPRCEAWPRLLRFARSSRQHLPALPVQRQHRPQQARQLRFSDRRMHSVSEQHIRASLRAVCSRILWRCHWRQGLQNAIVINAELNGVIMILANVFVGPTLKEHCAIDVRVNHWGFQSCGGCRSCNCGRASTSEQCDLETGQCSCQPGAGGLTCDLCEPGYWNYSPNGCVSCNCDEKYSAGAVCNAVTGQCQCLPGVLGDKCDSCPYRWVFVKNEGCLECDVCVHGLLDATDALEHLISPVTEEMKDVSSSYFANKRLQNVNSTADTLRLGVDELLLDPTGLDYSPLVSSIQDIEKKRDAIDRTANHLHFQAETVDTDADTTRINALEVEKLIRDTIDKVNEIIEELGKLSEGIQGSLGPDIDNLIQQAEYILEDLRNRDFDPAQNDTVDEYTACEELLDHVKSFELPVLESKMKFEEENEKLKNLIAMLEDLKNNSQRAYAVADDAQTLQEELQGIPIEEIIALVEENGDKVYDILKNGTDLLEKAKAFIQDARKSYGNLNEDAERLMLAIRDLKDNIQDTEESFNDLTDPIREATEHAAFLMDQAMLLDQSLANTRNSSEAAVKAAKAYANIEEAINDAYEAAEAALKAADLAGSMSDGILDKTRDSKDTTAQLLESAYQLEDQVTALEPQLQLAKDGVLLIGYQNGKTTKGLEHIRKDLDKLPLHSLGALAELAANDSAAADQVAQRARERIEDMVSKLPDDEIRAKEVPKAIEDSKQAIKAAHSYADRVASIVPDTNALIDKASKKESAMRIIGTDVSDKIAKLQQKVAIARTQANRIKTRRAVLREHYPPSTES